MARKVEKNKKSDVIELRKRIYKNKNNSVDAVNKFVSKFE